MARIVVVDDNEGVRSLLRAYVARSGLEFEIVAEASNGEEAVDVVREASPDAVILDWEMPVLDGPTALPLLREVIPEAAIVMFSSRGPEGAADALQAGADAYVDKDAGPGRVLEELARLLR